MTSSGRTRFWRSPRRAALLLAAAAACWGAVPPQARAAQVQAYLLFEIAASADGSAVAERLRSTSLGNCLQLIIGRHTRDVFLHVACDERGERDTSYLNQAVLALSRVDGIARATVVSLKHGTN
jgi:hypothetical protein